MILPLVFSAARLLVNFRATVFGRRFFKISISPLFVLPLFLSFAYLQCLSFPEIAEAASPEEMLSAGIEKYQGGKFDEASQIFEDALKLQPENRTLLYNLGLAQYKRGKVGSAIGMWRRALDLGPRDRDARNALEFALKTNPPRALAHEGSFEEELRSNLLSRISFDLLLLLTWLVVIRAAWLWMKLLGKRKEALQTNQPTPPWPISFILVSVFGALLFCLSALKTADYLSPRATVIAQKSDARTGPSEEQASLFELTEGNEVLIRRTEKDWVQVTYPGGKTGWVLKNTLVHSSGKNPW